MLCALSAFWLVLWTTPYGLGVSPDSIAYFSTARNIFEGNGFLQENAKPMTHYPPAYPLLLASARCINSDAMQSAIWLHAALFAANVLLIAILAYLSANKNLSAVLCSVGLFLSCSSMLEIHTMAWSEPSFITFSLSSVILLSCHISKPRFPILAASAIFLSLALTTRYVGITLLPPMIAALFLFGDRAFKEKIRDAVILLLTGSAPLAVWLIRNMVVAGTAANRQLIFHPITISDIKTFSDTIYQFWFPIGAAWQFGMLIILPAFISVIGAVRIVFTDQQFNRKYPDTAVIVQSLSLMFSITYIVFLFFSISFIDADTPLTARILSPIYVFGTVLVISLVRSISELKKSLLIWRIFATLCFLLIFIHTDRLILSAAALHQEGRGYNSSLWRTSKSLAYVKSLPKEVSVYSNGHDVISFLTEKDAKMIPPKLSPVTHVQNADFQKNSEAICQKVAQNKAVIVYLDNITWRWYLPDKAEFRSLCGMPAALKFDDGVIFVGRNSE